MKLACGIMCFAVLAGCTAKQDPGLTERAKGRSFTVEYEQAAEIILDNSPHGIAIGEVHGQREGIEFLKAEVSAALSRQKKNSDTFRNYPR